MRNVKGITLEDEVMDWIYRGRKLDWLLVCLSRKAM